MNTSPMRFVICSLMVFTLPFQRSYSSSSEDVSESELPNCSWNLASLSVSSLASASALSRVARYVFTLSMIAYYSLSAISSFSLAAAAVALA